MSIASSVVWSTGTRRWVVVLAGVNDVFGRIVRKQVWKYL
jgi:hypothetical protein